MFPSIMKYDATFYKMRYDMTIYGQRIVENVLEQNLDVRMKHYGLK